MVGKIVEVASYRPMSRIIGSHLRVASTPNVAFTKVVRSIHLYEWATKRQSGLSAKSSLRVADNTGVIQTTLLKSFRYRRLMGFLVKIN